MKGLSITAIGLLILHSVWFNDYLDKWNTNNYLVTYESLPLDYAIYERLDKIQL